jgi:Ankyrin repeat
MLNPNILTKIFRYSVKYLYDISKYSEVSGYCYDVIYDCSFSLWCRIFDKYKYLIFKSCCNGDQKIVELWIHYMNKINYSIEDYKFELLVNPLSYNKNILNDKKEIHEYSSYLSCTDKCRMCKLHDGKTPLFFAIKYNHMDIVELLKKNMYC